MQTIHDLADNLWSQRFDFEKALDRPTSTDQCLWQKICTFYESRDMSSTLAFRQANMTIDDPFQIGSPFTPPLVSSAHSCDSRNCRCKDGVKKACLHSCRFWDPQMPNDVKSYNGPVRTSFFQNRRLTEDEDAFKCVGLWDDGDFSGFLGAPPWFVNSDGDYIPAFADPVGFMRHLCGDKGDTIRLKGLLAAHRSIVKKNHKHFSDHTCRWNENVEWLTDFLVDGSNDYRDRAQLYRFAQLLCQHDVKSRTRPTMNRVCSKLHVIPTILQSIVPTYAPMILFARVFICSDCVLATAIEAIGLDDKQLESTERAVAWLRSHYQKLAQCPVDTGALIVDAIKKDLGKHFLPVSRDNLLRVGATVDPKDVPINYKAACLKIVESLHGLYAKLNAGLHLSQKLTDEIYGPAPESSLTARRALPATKRSRTQTNMYGNAHTKGVTKRLENSKRPRTARVVESAKQPVAQSVQDARQENSHDNSLVAQKYADSRAKMDMYEKLFGHRTPLQTARELENFAQDPMANESWRHLCSVFAELDNVEPLVWQSLPKLRARALLYDADEINRMMWIIISVAMADSPVIQGLTTNGTPCLLNRHAQRTLESGHCRVNMPTCITSFWMKKTEIMNSECPTLPNDPFGDLQQITPIHDCWVNRCDAFAMLCIGFQLALFRESTQDSHQRQSWTKLWDPDLIHNLKRRKAVSEHLDGMLGYLEIFNVLGHDKCQISYENVADSLRDRPELSGRVLGFLTERFFNTSWFWAHMRAIAIAKRSIQVTYDEEDYTLLPQSFNTVHFLERSDHQTYPSCSSLDLGRQSWDAMIAPLLDGRTPLDSLRAYKGDDNRNFRFYYMYAPPGPDLNGPLVRRHGSRKARDERQWSLFDNHLLASSDEMPNVLEWIQTVNFVQDEPNARLHAMYGRSYYDSGRPLFHEISGTEPLWRFLTSEPSSGFVVAVPEDVTIVGTDVPTVAPPNGGWRSPVFVTTQKSMIEIYAVFSQYDSLKHYEDKLAVDAPMHSLVEVSLFRSMRVPPDDHPLQRAPTPDAFVKTLESLGGEMTKSSIAEAIHPQTYGVASSEVRDHLLSRFKPFHGFLFKVSQNLLPSCVSSHVVPTETFFKTHNVVLRSFLEIPFANISTTVNATSVWWPVNPDMSDK